MSTFWLDKLNLVWLDNFGCEGSLYQCIGVCFSEFLVDLRVPQVLLSVFQGVSVRNPFSVLVQVIWGMQHYGKFWDGDIYELTYHHTVERAMLSRGIPLETLQFYSLAPVIFGGYLVIGGSMLRVQYFFSKKRARRWHSGYSAKLGDSVDPMPALPDPKEALSDIKRYTTVIKQDMVRDPVARQDAQEVTGTASAAFAFARFVFGRPLTWIN